MTQINGNISNYFNSCTGCRACEQVCSQKAISIRENKEGFLYPFVNEDKCVSCARCLKHCHIQVDFSSKPINAFGIKLKDRESLLNSASGGAAYILCKTIIESGGVAFGAAYDENLVVKHICVDTVKDLERLQSSKYVQSDTGDTYKTAEKILKRGKKVIYCGTPCQIAGLKSYLGKEYDNLFTVDIVCHGVPSPLLFKLFLQDFENKIGSKIIKWDCRNKRKKGWGLYYYYYYCENDTTGIGPFSFTTYGQDFINGLNYRESCYICKYSNIEYRPGDITVCDYWRLMAVNSKFYSNDGVSGLIIHSPKGKKAFEMIINDVNWFECNSQDIVLGQDNLKHPTKRPASRDSYYDGLGESFFTNKKIRVQLKDRILYILPQKLIIFMKRLKGIILK